MSGDSNNNAAPSVDHSEVVVRAASRCALKWFTATEDVPPSMLTAMANARCVNSSGIEVCSNKLADFFDLKKLPVCFLLDVISLLNKCTCIWHKPTRDSMPHLQRSFAYGLLLLKLRECDQYALIFDAYNLVRQLITCYFNNSQDTKVTEQQNNQPEKESKTLTAKKEPGCTFSPTEKTTLLAIIQKHLQFLEHSEEPNVDEFVYNKNCSFCNAPHTSSIALWHHMVDIHIHRKSSKPYLDDNEDFEMESLDNRCQSTIKSWKRVLYSSDMESEYNSSSSAYSMPAKKSRTKQSGQNKEVTMKLGLDFISTTRLVNSEIDFDSEPLCEHLMKYDEGFLQDFIQWYRQHECLWKFDSNDYKNDSAKDAAYDDLRKKYCEARNMKEVSVTTIKTLIRHLHSYYHGLRCPDAKNYRSHIWRRLAFIENGQQTDFECTECNKCFKSAANLARHVVKMHPVTKCRQCNKVFKNGRILKEHLLNYHANNEKCPLCHTENWNNSQHMAQHFPDYICSKCSAVFSDETEFKEHKRLQHGKVHLKCFHCDAIFDTKVELRRHSKVEHDDDRPFRCEFCELSFKYHSPLSKHLELHKRLENLQ